MYDAKKHGKCCSEFIFREALYCIGVVLGYFLSFFYFALEIGAKGFTPSNFKTLGGLERKFED